MRLAVSVAVTTLSLGVAAYALVVYSILPLGTLVHPDMRAGFLVHAPAVYAHVFGSAVALAFGPFQFLPRWRAAHMRLHRWSGRIYLSVGVLIGGLAGVFLAFHAYGGAAARAGFAGLALAWLLSGLFAYRAIRRREVGLHRRWMVRNFALTFAAVTLRLYLPASVVLGVPFELAYPAIAWLCWVPNIVVAQLFLNSTHRPSAPA
jgi:uncharacterized membrane protein